MAMLCKGIIAATYWQLASGICCWHEVPKGCKVWGKRQKVTVAGHGFYGSVWSCGIYNEGAACVGEILFSKGRLNGHEYL